MGGVKPLWTSNSCGRIYHFLIWPDRLAYQWPWCLRQVVAVGKYHRFGIWRIMVLCQYWQGKRSVEVVVSEKWEKVILCALQGEWWSPQLCYRDTWTKRQSGWMDLVNQRFHTLVRTAFIPRYWSGSSSTSLLGYGFLLEVISGGDYSNITMVSLWWGEMTYLSSTKSQ